MNKKTMLIGLGVLAVAGIGYYMWKKKQGQGEEKKSNFREGSQDYNHCLYLLSEKNGGVNTAEHKKTCSAEKTVNPIKSASTL
jgi:hypothetical protein